MLKLFACRDARLYLIGQFVSIAGDRALWLAAAIWVAELTHSSGAAGLTFFFMALPSLAAPLAGLVVDRVRRRPLLLAINLGTGLLVLTLLLVHDRNGVWLIWAVMLGYGASSTLSGPAQSALLTVIVPEPLLGDANGALQTVGEGLRLISPLVGAGLFTLVGGGLVAVLDAGTFGVAAFSLLLLAVREPKPVPSSAAHWRRELSAGFQHLLRTTVLRQLTLAAGMVLLVIGLCESVGFAVVGQGLHEPPSFFGVLIWIQGVGAVLGGPTAAPAIRRLGEGVVAAIGMLAFALGAALWIVPSLPVVAAGCICAGVGLPWIVVGAYTMLQRRSPPHLQGRVFSAFNIAAGTPQTLSIGLGAVLVGILPYQLLLTVVATTIGVAGLWLVTRRAQHAVRREVTTAEP